MPAHHVQYDAQLQSDIETVAQCVRAGCALRKAYRCPGAGCFRGHWREAMGHLGEVATFDFAVADVSWGEGNGVSRAAVVKFRPCADEVVLALRWPSRGRSRGETGHAR